MEITSKETRRSYPVAVRLTQPLDVKRLVLTSHAAYPDLVGDNIVLTEAQIRAHIAIFPRGQRVAELEGEIVGGISTFIVPRGVDPLRPHSWLEICGEGYFQSHDAGGDTLYLADIFVDPRAQRCGVGAKLYASLKEICVEQNLKRIVAGGRLDSYHRHAARMGPRAYVERVIAGEIQDRVLRSQLKAGFQVRGVLPNYLHDRRSQNFASLLEWTRA
jgi:GNAT superfamily N-acetyltransferase